MSDEPDVPREAPRRKRARPEPSLRARALAALARREHTRQELERKLAPHAPEPEELAAVLDDFERRGWLSERRFVEQVVHARRRRFGGSRIRQELLAKGVSEVVVDETLSGLAGSEVAAAREVWRRKFGEAPRSAAERARQIRFLQGRGFTLDTIMRVLKQRGEEDV